MSRGPVFKFDIRGQRCVVYSSIKDLETRLSQELTAMFPGGFPGGSGAGGATPSQM